MTTIPDIIAKLNPTITHVRNPLSPEDADFRNTADQWRFDFGNGLTQDYYTGIGHRVARPVSDYHGDFKRLRYKKLTASGLKDFLTVSKPVPPKLDDLLSSLASDAQAATMTFSEWCSDLGYSDDSLKAREVYFACQDAAYFLRRLGFTDLEALREHYRDY